MQAVAAKIQHVMKIHENLLKHTLTHAQRKAIAAFIQSPDDLSATFMQQRAPNVPEYASQSGAIFGVLTQMKETFENNLSQSQKDETTAQKQFELLKASKEEEIATGKAMIDSKTQELATTNEKNAQAAEDKEDTINTLSADEKFLMNLKEHCTNVDAEWEERQKTRELEMEACSKAMAVLTSDEARDLTSRTLSFAQKSSAAKSKRRSQAAKISP
jgi:hypothetical protein